MAKVDYTRDYYADLELSPSCSNDDVRKQFHKLARLYHPDKNPGKETEITNRFQIIQAANEVLSDPDQRAKYDASRRRGTVNNSFARPPPPRKNPPYEATSNFPPPPRRTPQNPRPPPENKAHPKGFTHWTGPPPPQRNGRGGAQQAREKQSAYSAWQAWSEASKGQPNNRHNPAPPVPPRGAAPKTTPESPVGGPMPSTRPVPPRPTSPYRPTYDEKHGRPPPGQYQPNPGPPPRKTGFEHGSHPTNERPVSMNSFVPRYDRDMPPGAPPPPPPRGSSPSRNAAPTVKKFDWVKGEYRTYPREQIPVPEVAPKTKTPYPANVREKTYIDPGNLKRSNSYRDPRNQQKPEDSHLQAGNAPSYERRRSAEGPFTESQTDGTTNPQWQKSSRSRPFLVYSSSEDSDSDSTRPQAPRPKTTRSASVGSISENSSVPDAADGPPKDRPKAQPTSRTGPNFNSTTWDTSPNAQSPGRKSDPLSEYAFPAKSDTFPLASNPDLEKQNPERNDQEFSPTDTTGTNSNIPRSGSYPNVNAFRARNEGASSTTAKSPQGFPRGEVPFHADKWARDIEEQNWASQWATPTESRTSPTRVPRKAAGSAPTRSNTEDSTGSTSRISKSAQEEEYLEQTTSSAEASNFPGGNIIGNSRAESPDINAMDIDTEVPAAERRPSIMVDDTNDPQTKPRAVHVEPSRPEWRERKDADADFNRRPSLPQSFSFSSSSQTSNGLQTNSQRLNGQYGAQKRRGRPSPQLSMDDFHNVTPFAKQSPSGLGNMGDLSADLPFPSRASNTNPALPFETNEDSLTLPKPPKPPPLPQTNDWDFYLTQMAGYMSSWNDFNSAMLTRFQNHNKELEIFEKIPCTQDSGVVYGWLAAKGETRDLKGWESYASGMKEEQRWRTHWNVAWEKHVATMEAHGKLRQRLTGLVP